MSENSTGLLVDGTRPVTREALLERLSGLGIEARTVAHPPVFTVDEAKAVRRGLPGAHTKSLFVRDKKGAMWLIVALEDRPVDLAAVADMLGHKRFSFGSPERLMRFLGVSPGAVSPFATINDHSGAVSVALDVGLKDHDVWNLHPLDNEHTTAIAAADMLRFLEDVRHAPRWVDLGG
jgi:Ala-tRNA(Pro) deacylase